MDSLSTFSQGTSSVLLMWTTVEGVRYPTLRGPDMRILEPFTSYIHAVVVKTNRQSPAKAAKSKVDAATYALKGLAEFLIAHRRSLRTFDDDLFVKYREAQLDTTLESARGRNSERKAKATTNIKVRWVYDFLDWASSNFLLPSGTIGEGCRVESILPSLRGSKDKARTHLKYPNLYTGYGEDRAWDEGQYWATDEDIVEIERFFVDEHGAEAAARNILLLRLGEFEGWRVGSLVSLTIDKFSEEALAKQDEKDAFEVIPNEQKLGYQYSFSVPWPIAHYVRRYIKTDRARLMKSCGVDESVSRYRIFLNVDDGTPLQTKSVTNFFSKAFRAAGAPKGAAVHALRRRKGQIETEKESDSSGGPSIDPLVKQTTVAEVLGHGRFESARAYRRSNKQKRLQSTEERQAETIAALKLENAELRAQNKALLNSKS